MGNAGVSIGQVKALWAKACDFMKGKCRHCGQFLSLRNPVCRNPHCPGQGEQQGQPQSWPSNGHGHSSPRRALDEAQSWANVHEDALGRAAWAATNARDATLRARAVDMLGKMGNARSVSTLVHSLRDKDAGVRKKSAEALARIGSPNAIPALTQALHDDKDENVRWRAAAALGRIGNERAVPVLTQALRDQSFNVRLRAVAALRKTTNLEDQGQHHQVTRLLIYTFHNDSDWRVRQEAAQALGVLGGRDSVDALIRKVQNGDGNQHVYDAAVAALERATRRRTERG